MCLYVVLSLPWGWGDYKGNSSLLYQVPVFLARAIVPILRNFYLLWYKNKRRAYGDTGVEKMFLVKVIFINKKLYLLWKNAYYTSKDD
jgi:hypothetical protein